MAKLAKLIRVTREGKSSMRLEVDGEEFPWYLGPEGVTLSVSGDGYAIAALNLSLLAERIEVVDALDAPKAERVEDEAELVRGLE